MQGSLLCEKNVYFYVKSMCKILGEPNNFIFMRSALFYCLTIYYTSPKVNTYYLWVDLVLVEVSCN